MGTGTSCTPDLEKGWINVSQYKIACCDGRPCGDIPFLASELLQLPGLARYGGTHL